MRALIILALTAGIGGLADAAAAQQQNLNVRGTIVAVESNLMRVQARDGRDVDVVLPEGLAVATTKAFSLADVKPGMVLGVTTVRRADGATIAIDVRPIAPAANRGLFPYDLQPEATMTNAVLEGSVQAAGGDEFTLNYQSGTVKVLVPPGTPMSQAVPGSRDDLKAGETVFIAARPDPTGRLTAVRIQVSKDGVKPTQ
jgi:hypothetical protein